MMNSTLDGGGWISDYMAWTDAENWAFGRDRVSGKFYEEGQDSSPPFALAYLDWMDSWQALRNVISVVPRQATVLVTHADGLDATEDAEDLLWDAYMVAAHTDSDCLPQLRRMIAVSVRPDLEALAA